MKNTELLQPGLSFFRLISESKRKAGCTLDALEKLIKMAIESYPIDAAKKQNIKKAALYGENKKHGTE